MLLVAAWLSHALFATVSAQTQNIYVAFHGTWATDINTDPGCAALCLISLVKLLLIFILMLS